MQLYYDTRDQKIAERRGDQRLYWLDDLGAKPFCEVSPNEQGFIFTGARSLEDYRDLVADYPLLYDDPQQRAPLLRLDTVLDILKENNINIPTPTTWKIEIDDKIPKKIRFPLFVRTAKTSWKLGGQISFVQNRKELRDEMELLRRAFHWDATILARDWLQLEEVGTSTYGAIPNEIRVWIVDGTPRAWSFHHLHVIQSPTNFPPSTQDLQILCEYATQIGKCFQSRLIVADFAKTQNGEWWFLEAGPGSCAGTAHEGVFKAVTGFLIDQEISFTTNAVGGVF